MSPATYERLCRTLGALQVHRLFRGPGPYLGTVLMFHRVASATEIQKHPFTRDLWVTPEKLQAALRYFTANGYEIASLDRMHEALSAGSVEKPLAVFTFDDGFRDNYELALPIFKRHASPFAIYIASGLPDGGAVAWPYALEELVLGRESLEWEIDGVRQRLPLDSPRSKLEGYDQLRETLLPASPEMFAKLCNAIFTRNGIDLPEFSQRSSMTWEQIRSLARDPLVTLGGHTANHYKLSRLGLEEGLAEIELGRARLEAEIGKSVCHFAYPYGCKPKVENITGAMCDQLKFRTCVTTCPGLLCPEHGLHRASLTRFQVSEPTSFVLLDVAFKRLIDCLRCRPKQLVIG